MISQDLVAQFQEMNPGVDINSPEGQAQFNSWAGQQPGGGQTPSNGPTNSNPFSPTGTNLNDAANAALLSGATKAAAGGNTYQVQGGAQQGVFNTQGSTSGAQTQQQANQSNTTGTQSQATTGTQNQNTSSTGSTTGLTTTAGQHGVTDTLGFGQLLQGQAPAAQTNDANRNAYLNDLVNTGGSGFNQQVDAAVRQSQSGPGMQGVGQSGQDRAAAYATEAVARDNQNQRLAASSQLAGPTATQTLASAGNPYLGSTDTGVQANVGTQQGQQNTTGTSTSNTSGTSSQNTSSLGNLFSSSLENQSQAGTSAANNTQIAAGNQPEQGSSKSGGGSVVCTALVERGMLDRVIANAEVDYIKENWDTFKRAAKGYYSFGLPIAKWVRRSKVVAVLCWPLASACAKEAARRHGLPIKQRWWRMVAYAGFFVVCDTIGRFVRKEPRITDVEILCMLNLQGLNLNQH